MKDMDGHYMKWKYAKHQGGVGFAYFLGMLGAAVYYIQTATSFGDGLLGLLKALVWPAFLVFHLLGLGNGGLIGL